MTQTAALYQLQTLDSQIDVINRRLAEIAGLLAGNEALQSAQSAVTDARQAQQHWQARLTDLELERQQLKEEADASEAHLYSGRVQNPRELTDLQNKVAELRRRYAALEEPILEAMLEVEDHTARLEEAERQLNRVTAEQATIASALTGEQARLMEQLQRLNNEVKRVRAGIQPAYLQWYDRLRQRSGGIAVAEIGPGLECGACGVQLTSSMGQQVRRGEVLPCPTCGRILYRR